MYNFIKKSKTICFVYSFISSFNAPYRLRRKSKIILKQYRGKHKGERCFIIGNGPSLSSKDLDLLKDEVCFAANRIYKIFTETEWRPTYYCVQDLKLADKMAEEMLSAIDTSDACFFRMSKNEQLNEIMAKQEKISLVPLWCFSLEAKELKFTDRADRFLYDGGTVTYMSMQLAAYMGFKEIYLLGVDHSLPYEMKKDGTVIKVDMSLASHFYETKEDNNTGWEHRSYTKFFQDMAYQAAEDFSKKNGKFRIYNATRGGKLETYERVKLEDIL